MHNVLILPCSTQIAVEQYFSLVYNKHFNLIGASHNKSDELFNVFITLQNTTDSIKFIDEIKSIIKKYNIDIILPSHDEINTILKNDIDLSKLIPGSDTDIVNILRSKSLTYTTLNKFVEFRQYLPEFTIIDNKFLKPDKGQGSKGTLYIKEPYLICEYLPGKEYTIDCFSDKNCNLIFCNSRHRKKIENGISELTEIIDSDEMIKIAQLINQFLSLKGYWFFQLKQDKNNNLKLMEIAPRIAGCSSINRLNGINLTALGLYQHLDIKVNILKQNLVKEIHRKNPKLNLDYNTIFVDYDDTFLYIENILKQINKEIIILTRHKNKINTHYKTIYVADTELKSSYIKKFDQYKSIFIDDSFKERYDVYHACKIPVLDVGEVRYLI
jgi:hypothetical protein